MRHLEARELHLQETISRKLIEIMHIKGMDNPADILTKFVDYTTLEKNLTVFGLVDMKAKIVATIQKLASLPWKAPIFVGAVLMQTPVAKAMPDGGHDEFQVGTFEYVLLVWSCLCFIAGFVLRGRASPAQPVPPPKPPQTVTQEVGMNTDASVPVMLTPSSSSAAASSSSSALVSESVHFSSKSDTAHLDRQCGHLMHCERVLSYSVCKDCVRASARRSRR